MQAPPGSQLLALGTLAGAARKSSDRLALGMLAGAARKSSDRLALGTLAGAARKSSGRGSLSVIHQKRAIRCGPYYHIKRVRPCG